MDVAVFVSNKEIIVCGVDKNGNPIDNDGTLFGEKSGRHIDEYDRFDPDFCSGHRLHLTMDMVTSIKG